MAPLKMLKLNILTRSLISIGNVQFKEQFTAREGAVNLNILE